MCLKDIFCTKIAFFYEIPKSLFNPFISWFYGSLQDNFGIRMGCVHLEVCLQSDWGYLKPKKTKQFKSVLNLL